LKLATFTQSAGEPRIGIVVDDGLIDVTRQLSDAPTDMVVLINHWDAWRSRFESLVSAGNPDLTLAAVTLQAPVARPGKIFGIGLNYADHVAESGMAKPADQLWFTKAVTSVTGPYAGIERPKVSTALDYEAELAFVVGKRGRHIPVERAHEFIFGYCVSNDVSIRDWQLKTSQFVLGKSFDTHCPYGPWLVTPDELGDPHALAIRCLVNGEVRQSSNTKQLIFNCYEQVAHLSHAMTLEAGDLILTGTPGGVGAACKPPRWLAIGDVVRVEIEGIGYIENRVVAEAE
jgi:2-keto-4-pentenoate hydratase/2-oxohepta-3-ene-1,7-dioic acid hydratase in catechol pathway